MGSIIVMDPAVAIPATTEDEQSSEFWVRFLGWLADPRTRFGQDTYELFTQYYSEKICMKTVSFPAGMHPSIAQASARILAKAPVGQHDEDRSYTFDPQYILSSPHREALEHDVVAILGNVHVSALGTRESHWSLWGKSLSIDSGQLYSLTLHVVPGQPTAAEIRDIRYEFYCGKSLTIYGGQQDRKLMSYISENFGIKLTDIRWVPSEKNKIPREIKPQIRGLQGANALVICLTGKIGHAVSGKISTMCKQYSVEFVPCETVGDIKDFLDNLIQGY